MAKKFANFSVTLFVAFWADRHQSRGIPAALISLVAVAGYALKLGRPRLSVPEFYPSNQ